MRIDITNQRVEKDGDLLQDVVWVDIDNTEACIFCHDHEGRKIPTDQDPTGYETIRLKGNFTVTSEVFVHQIAEPTNIWGLPSYPNCMSTGNVNLQNVSSSMGIPGGFGEYLLRRTLSP